MAATARLSLTRWLRELSAPALGVTVEPAEDLDVRGRKITVKVLDGQRMTDTPGCFRELAARFQLPDATGWDSLDDWMRDLSWLGESDGYLGVVRHAEKLLQADEAALRDFTQSVAFWAEYWRDSAAQGELGVAVKDVPLRVLLHTSQEGLAALTSRLDHAGAAWAAVSLES